MALQLRSRGRTLGNPSLIQFFSTTTTSSSNPPPPPPPDSNDPNGQSNSSTSQSSMSSYFSDVKASLRNRQPSSPPQPRMSKSPNHQPSLFRPSKLASLEEIRKNLSEFRLRTAVPSPNETNPTPSSSAPNFSSHDSYKPYVIGKREQAEKGAGAGGIGGFTAIRDSLKQLRPNGNTQNENKAMDPMSLSELKNTLKLKPTNPSSPGNSSSPSKVFGGTEPLVFGRESREKKDVHSSNAMRTEFLKMYRYGELGDKLRKLRPEAKGEGWFSWRELNDRLMKLRDMEEKEIESKAGGFSFKDLRDSLTTLKLSDTEKSKVHRLDILGQLGRTPEFMLNPPQEHLVETYFHPDNMSSAEKMKLELAKVRDEFKMSESDCGSARVQVAQLTTKIKHLSSVLHKKDKHSRKGLVAMVQRRKKLLKYLRRVDWDSYCFVLSKLGLRDNPDYKN